MTHRFDPKTVKARKDHRCDLCEETITIGQSHLAQKIVSEGGWFSWRAHHVCETIRQSDPDHDLAEDAHDQVNMFYSFLCDQEPEQIRVILRGKQSSEIDRLLNLRNRNLIHYGTDYNP